MINNEYFEKFKDPRWQKIRLEIMERSDWKCDVCRAETKTLNIHHGYYKYGIDPWDLPKDTLWCLCDQCHQEAQQNLAEIKLELGRISPEDYEDVLRSLWLLQGEDN